MSTQAIQPSAPTGVPRHRTTDLVAAQDQWHGWIVQACHAVGVCDEDVDVAVIHALTRDIAHDIARPMAPVGSYILGLAVGAATAVGRDTSLAALTTALRATFPALVATEPEARAIGVSGG